jgi:hypothetical protein
MIRKPSEMKLFEWEDELKRFGKSEEVENCAVGVFPRREPAFKPERRHLPVVLPFSIFA